MEHKTLEQLERVAVLRPDRAPEMSMAGRLDRWIYLLEQDPDRSLNALHQTEYQPHGSRDEIRRDDTAISLAYRDPILRREGLLGDTYGDARRFFGLSQRDLHWVTCDCHTGAKVDARSIAWRLRSVRRCMGGPSVFVRAWRFMSGRSAAET